MSAVWTVVFDLHAMREIRNWDKANQIKLDAIHTLLRTEGPAGLGWSSLERAGCSAWDGLGQAYHGVFWTAFDERFYRVALEVRPGRTVIVRGAAHGVYRRGPKGR